MSKPVGGVEVAGAFRHLCSALLPGPVLNLPGVSDSRAFLRSVGRHCLDSHWFLILQFLCRERKAEIESSYPSCISFPFP